MVHKKKVVVIGGGPAGMMAAGTASNRGLEVFLVEKNRRLGRKLLLTGKGRCNITNSVELEGLVANVPVNGRFLYSAFNSFSNTDLIRFLAELGVETKVERGGRVFPVSDRSVDVVEALKRYLLAKEVKIITGEAIRVTSSDNAVYSVLLKDGRELSCDSVVVATGGLSYPQTGSTGDGYRFAQENGHKVTDLQPALVPLEVEEEWVREAQGLSLKNIAISLYDQEQKKVYTDFGEMLFTHFGVSGPVVLSASIHLREMERASYRLVIDLKPALDESQMDRRLQREFAEHSRKNFSNSLSGLLPRKLIPIMVKLAPIPPDKPAHQITKEERQNLGWLFKNLTLSIKKRRPLTEAIITAGGVDIREINPSTMESKIVRGLFFAGEVIDVNAYTGGYNLQIAFSTGYLAGSSC